MRKVEEKDFQILFQWVNDEEVIKNSRYGKGKSLEEFTLWFNEMIHNKDAHMFIMEDNNEYIGQIYFQVENNESILTYSVDKDFRNRGFGKSMVKFIEEYICSNLNEINRISAYINSSNISSIKVFEKLGYMREIDDKYYVKLVKVISKMVKNKLEIKIN